MNGNIKLSDRIPVLGAIDPDVYAAGSYTSDYVDMSQVHSMIAIVMAGTLGTSATLDAKLVEATDSSGTGAQDLSGKAITQLTQAGSDSDKQAIINLRADEMSDGFTHAALVITVATASSDAGAVLIGGDARIEPLADLSSVDEIV